MHSLLLLLLSLCPCGTTHAGDTLAAIRERGYFTFGGDTEGGAPFVFPDPADPSRTLGCDVDLANELAQELARELGVPVEARFAQSPWEKLPDLLGTGRVDVVLDGYEWMPERARQMRASLPYYVYELQLLARSDAAGVERGWEWLRATPRKRVGILGGSAAERWMSEHCPEAELVSYDGVTNAMGDVVLGRVDATLQDLPIAISYAREFPALRATGERVGAGRYVAYVRRDDEEFGAALDRAILALRVSGKLESIFTRYGCWTEAQKDPQLLALPEATAEEGERASFLARYAPTLLEAAGMTVLLSIASFPIAIALGLLVALGRRYGPRWIAWPLGLYVEVLRGTPLMLQLFVLFYVLPNLGLRLDAFLAAVLGLAINYSAYEAEIYRAGLQAVPAGQMEAALALGMSRQLALRRIVLPQAVRIVIPATTNDFSSLFKDTSVCSVITVVELTKRYNIAAMSHPAEVLPLALCAALLYLAMSWPLALLSSRLERRLRA